MTLQPQPPSAGHPSGDVVVRDGCVHWHSLSTCEVRDAREGVVAYRTSLRDAWTSRLLPCPSCAARDAAVARARWGDRTRVERARLTLPVLQDLRTGVTIVPASAPAPTASRLPPLPEVDTSTSPVGAPTPTRSTSAGVGGAGRSTAPRRAAAGL